MKCVYFKNGKIIAYSNAVWFTVGHPPKGVFRRGAEDLKEIADALKPYCISVGWWFRMTVNFGPNKDFQRIVRPDGALPTYSNCPICPNVQKTVSDSIAFFDCIGICFFEKAYYNKNQIKKNMTKRGSVTSNKVIELLSSLYTNLYTNEEKNTGIY